MWLLPSLLLVVRVAGQEVWSYLPVCAQPCAALAAESDPNCTSTDYACLCASATFSKTSTCCVRSQCDTSDDTLVWEESQAFCSDFGVSITRVAESACSSTTSYSIPTSTSATTSATTSISATATDTASPVTITNTISLSDGQVTAVTITYTPTATGTATSTVSSGISSGASSASSNDSSSGLSEGAKIGIGVGAGVGGLAIIGGMIALIVYCCTRRRRKSNAAAGGVTGSSTAYAPVNTVGDGTADPAVFPMYDEFKPELDTQQVPGQQRLQQQQYQQHNPAAVPASALPASLTTPISPVSEGSGRTSELHAESQGYYQAPGSGAQELGGMSVYPQQQQQQHFQYHPGVVTQAEMPADQGHFPCQGHGQTRYELQ